VPYEVQSATRAGVTGAGRDPAGSTYNLHVPLGPMLGKVLHVEPKAVTEFVEHCSEGPHSQVSLAIESLRDL
jgi:methylaspartate ammonia-lyase